MNALSGTLPRRRLLRGMGAAAIGLPLLDAMSPSRSSAALNREDTSPRRFVAACATLGLHGPHLFPTRPGLDYEPTPYLKVLASHRRDFTVFSGLSHPEQQGANGHTSEMTWLTSAKRPGLAGFKNTISIDQLIAEKLGIETRFPSLVLSTSGRSMSWTSSGIEIPGETSPSRVFKTLFMDGTAQELKAEMRQLQRGQSILDTVLGQARSLQPKISVRDRAKLDEYLTAVRDLESRLQQSEEWVQRAKPKISAEQPKDVTEKNDAIGRQRLMYDMMVLALQTDSTRVISIQLSGMNAVPKIDGVSNDWHNLSHHGKDPDKIDELRIIEEAEFIAFNEFLTKLKNIEENGRPLLDHTTILFGSNLGNASSHDWHNLPVIVAGGGVNHQGYVAHDEKNNTPFANLLVSLGQNMGLEIDRFGSSTAAGLRGFELKS
jgi:Protein of unknown function (DUF1552)